MEQVLGARPEASSGGISATGGAASPKLLVAAIAKVTIAAVAIAEAFRRMKFSGFSPAWSRRVESPDHQPHQQQ